MNLKSALAATALAAAVSAQAATPAEKWNEECGGCHVAYPARFLPASTWTRIMAGLDRHFGSNASLDAQTGKEITDYLVANSATRKRNENPSTLRISDTRWFQNKHSEDLSPAVFRDPRVKSAANCGACHLGAAKGDFSEHNIRVPGYAGRHEGRHHDDD